MQSNHKLINSILMTTPETEELKRLVEEKYEKGLNTTTDFEEFSFYLQRTMDKHLSASTLKRLWGYVNDAHKPRIVTLDILAKYAGYHDFADFKEWLKRSPRYNSSFFDACQLTSSDLQEGKKITIGWSPNRLVKLRYLGNSTFEVLESHNSKLLAGDRFITGCFIMGQPLFLPFIERGGRHTPPFVAGRNGGLTIMEAT